MSRIKKWELDTTLKFIRCYKQHECLWNFSSTDYKNKTMRDLALIAIVKAMNMNNFGVQEVKDKIKNLRSTYCQEVKKVEESKKSGAGFSSVYTPNIKWLKEMEEVFMIDLKRNMCENVSFPSVFLVQEKLEQEEELTEMVSEDLSASDEENSCQSLVSNTVVNDASTLSTTTVTNANTAPRPRKRSREVIKAISDLKALHDKVNIEKEESPFDIFGKSVAMQLKKLSVENALLAQQNIQCILTEIGIEDHRQKTRNISDM